MSAIFLSASVPVLGRGDYYETADPFLIQYAVRELVTAILGRRLLVWGGHPAITPMISTVCEDLGVDYSKSVILYQSRYFEAVFPTENQNFDNIILVEAVDGDQNASLQRMRDEMLSRSDLEAAVFIGGMEGVQVEHDLYRRYHPNGTVLTVPSPGGAARELGQKLGTANDQNLMDSDFVKMFYEGLSIAPDEKRVSDLKTG